MCLVKQHVGGFWLVFLLVFNAGRLMGQAEIDLVISDIWWDSGQASIVYRLENLGPDQAPSGHQTRLEVEGQVIGTDTVYASLHYGEAWVGYFPTGWVCSDQKDTVIAEADFLDAVTETDELNNVIQEDWPCDTTPPTILSGPTVSNLGEDGAKVSWTTDESADSQLLFSRFGGKLEQSATSGVMTTNHQIDLSGLNHSTTYRYLVRSTDASGNTVQSAISTFQTKAHADGNDPQLSWMGKSSRRLPYVFEAEVDDDTGIERVVFSLDGALLEVDFSPPFQCILDPLILGQTAAQFYSLHTIAAEAFDFGGLCVSDLVTYAPTAFCFPEEFEFRCPDDGLELIGEGGSVPPGTLAVPVIIRASEVPFTERTNRYGITMEYGEPVDRIDLYIEDVLVASETDAIELLYYWDIVGLTVGHYDVRAEVFTGTDCLPLAETHTVHILNPYAEAYIANRTVSRSDNHFSVELTLRNTGSAPAGVIRVRDQVSGFQPIPSDSSFFTVTSSYDPETDLTDVTLNFAAGYEIPAESTRFVRYDLIPVMHVDLDEYRIGDADVRMVWVDEFSAQQTDSASLPWRGGDADEEVDLAFASSDYLTVTNPRALFQRFNDHDVNQLLCKTAELTNLRQGVMAFFDSCGLVRTAFDSNDSIAVGNIFRAGWDDEIYVADEDADRIRSYDETDELTLDDHRLPIEREGLHPHDGFAVGDVINFAGAAHHPSSEIMVIDGHDDVGRLTYYKYFSDTATFASYSMDTVYAPGDAVLCGNVLLESGRSEDELLIVSDDGMVTTYANHLTSTTSAPSNYDHGDLIALGNVIGDSAMEIIIGNLADHRIHIYRGDGSFYGDYALPDVSTFSSDDAIALADLDGSGYDQLIYADDSEDAFQLFAFDSAASSFSRRSGFDLRFDGDDALLTGDFLDTPGPELAVCRARRTDHHLGGEVEFFSYDRLGTLGERHELERLLKPGRAWAARMNSTWPENGFLLFVGEVQILPTFVNSYEISGEREEIRATDNYYANMSGQIKSPELAMGRMIGDTPALIAAQIQRTIDIIHGDVAFDGSNGLVVSGRNSGVGGGADWINFTLERYDIRDRLNDGGYTVSQLEDPSEAQIFSQATDKDVIHLAAHGSEWTWDVLDTLEIAADFDPGTHAPLIYLSACLTGYYSRLNPSVTEAFLNHGAGAVISATEVSYFPYGKYLAQGFYDRFCGGSEVGEALRGAKCARMGDTAYAKKNSCIFHLFGDPKLVPVTPTVPKTSGIERPTSVARGPGRATIGVQIPSYSVVHDSVENTDELSIEGGDALLLEGHPTVPAFPVRVDFPAGEQVQNVTLTLRDIENTSGFLRLPRVTPAVMGATGSSRARAETQDPEWWPDRDFDWDVVLNPDGSSELIIQIYPFLYHAGMGWGRFFQSYTFDVQTASSPVRIRLHQTDKSCFGTGEEITLNLCFENIDGQGGIDVLVESKILAADGRIVGGFPLRTLEGVEGLATLSLLWDSAATPSGTYEIDTRISSTDGTLWARDVTAFSLGSASLFAASLNATPECFGLGADVTLQAHFQNRGSDPVSGQAVIQVVDHAGQVLASFDQEIVDLPAGQSTLFEPTWVNATASAEHIEVRAWMTYSGRSTDVLSYVVPANLNVLYGQIQDWPSPLNILDLLDDLVCP